MKRARVDLDMTVVRLVQIALAEDIGVGDITSEGTIDADATGTATVCMNSDAVLCGSSIASLVVAEVDPTLCVTWYFDEGTWLPEGTVAGRISGPLASMLTVERTMLNFLQRMCGVATLTRTFVNAVSGRQSRIVDTRKTIPGWRTLDKYSVAVGGGVNHRIGLFDQAIIKDNHIAAAGSISRAVERLSERVTHDTLANIPVEVEISSLSQLDELLTCTGVDRVMFDNMTCEEIAIGVQRVAGRLETEASGGVSLESVGRIARTGVDYISVGALTHSAPASDISLDIESDQQ